MIPDRDRNLITAYVSDDLDAGGRRDAERLLERSPEARRLVEQLQSDARRLRELSRRRPDADVAAHVLRAIGERRVAIRPDTSGQSRPISIVTWGSLAAAVLAAFVTATYLLLADLPGVTQQAHRSSPPAKNLDRPTGRPLAPAPEEPADGSRDLGRRSFVGPSAPEGPQSSTDSTARADVPPETKPDSSAAKDAVLSSGPKPDLRPGVVILPSLTLPLPLRELERADLRRKLDEALRPDGEYRLELFCRDSAKGLERLQAAAKPYNLQVLVDATAQELIKLKVRVPYAVYLEGLTPEQLASLLRNLGARDKKAEERRVGDGTFDQLVLMPLTADDRKELVTLMGVDPTQPAAKPKGPSGVDVRKPLSESTAAQVAQSTPGQGGRAEVAAIVLPYGVVRPPAASKEVKQFLTGRRERPAGTVVVYLILRPGNG
jgi:hypothetical protein